MPQTKREKPSVNSEIRRVLVVDDDEAMRDMVIALLEDAGHTACGAEGANKALELLGDGDFDAVISDIRMPGRSGIELLGEIRELRPETPIIMMTAFGSIDSAVEAMQAGAFDYVTKPFKRDAVLMSLERAFEHRNLEQENRRLRKAVDRTSSFGDMIGISDGMREIFAMIRKVSDSRASVLITGESGTGKELVARTLHYSGARAKQPFIPVNCTAIPEGLMESELFGHVRGAFTGAVSTKRGLFEEANGGTIFLDEIGDMSTGLQSKLLRVLQDREIRPVGSTQSRKIDVRVITATNCDLRANIESGRFRKDLFYRLNVIPIQIPPLRERPEDISLLAEAFLRKHGDGRRFTLSPEATQLLSSCTWEGNARELENVIERAIAFADADELGCEDFPECGGKNERGSSESTATFLEAAAANELTLSELADQYTTQVLARTRGNKARAAKILGINRRTLYRRGFGASETQECAAPKDD
ncbi:MAG: sigma-54-dependent Fis family transcriptional regulator [Deltaproteobacteria bacterium]|nr:sigma-54-dependent Fis family transcriptional regulator [Deltaproteobacteria bacterium]